MLFPVLQIGIAANLSSVTVCGRAALGHLSLDLPQQAFLFSQRNTPLCPSVLSSTCCQILPKSSASVHQAGLEHVVERSSVVELLLFFLNALILVGAMGWGLCGKANP